MKKTLFLSAILGAALCSSAFGAETITVDGTSYTAAILGAAQATNPDSSVHAYLINYDVTGNTPTYHGDGNTNGWVGSLTADDTLIIAATDDSTYSAHNTFFDTGANVLTLNANIITGGSSTAGGRLRFWSQNATNKVLLNGDLTIAHEQANLWLQNGTIELAGALKASTGQVLHTTSDSPSSGTLKLTGDISGFSGTLKMDGGNVQIGNNLQLASGSEVAFTSGKISSVTNLVINGGTLGDISSSFASGMERIAASKNGSALTLNAGFEKTFASMTTTGSNGGWIFLNGVGDTTNGIYTDFILNSTSNGLLVNTSGTAAHIGNLSGTATSAEIRGDINGSGTDRVLVVHQTENTTFAGKFHHVDGRDVALIKEGTGTLTLSGDSTSTKQMTINAGGITISGTNAKWSGNVEINNGGTLTLATGGDTSHVTKSITVNAGATLASTAVDSIGYNDGYGNPTDSITLSGDAEHAATWTMTHRQTVMGTALTLSGNTVIKAGTGTLGANNNAPKLDYHSGAVTVTGSNNAVNVPLLLNGNMTIATGDSTDNVLTLNGDITGNNKTITVSGSGHLNIDGNLDGVTISGNANLVGNNLNSLSGAVTLGNMTNDLTGGGNFHYALVGGTSLTIAGNVDVAHKSDGTTTNENSRIGMGGDATITVQEGATLTAGAIINTKQTNWKTANAAIVVNAGGILNIGDADDTYTKSLTNGGTATIAGSAYIAALSNSGTLTLKKQNITIDSVTLGGGSVTLGTVDDHNVNLTTSGLTVNSNSALNANLVMNSGTLTFADDAILTMGCDVTIGNDVTVMLTDTMVESIQTGNWVEIIAGVDTADLSQSLTFAGSGTMSDYVTEHAGVYQLTQIGDKVYITPEPATATLSLLALAALASRRKRH